MMELVPDGTTQIHIAAANKHFIASLIALPTKNPRKIEGLTPLHTH